MTQPEAPQPLVHSTESAAQRPEAAIETQLTAAPTCPHCGYVDHDAWEWNFGPGMEGEHVGDCGSCGEEFKTEREVSVYYTTTRTASGSPQPLGEMTKEQP